MRTATTELMFRHSDAVRAMAAVCAIVGFAAHCSQTKGESQREKPAVELKAKGESQREKPAAESKPKPASTGGQAKPSAPGGPEFERGPVIDSHTLIAPLSAPIDLALAIFDRVGVVKFCNKNAGHRDSARFSATLRVKEYLGDRFEFFANLDWRGVNDPGWGKREADRFEAAVRLGAKGLKIFKSLGLGVRDARGKLLHVDDPRLVPIFRRAERLNAIVAMHTGDPKAFFQPITPENERYDELRLAPDWSFYGQDYPSRQQLLKERDRVVARHPNTTFLLIHLANNPEDIDYVASLLEKSPNVHVDTSARVPEIGRHPVAKLRSFFIRFQDRILFGTDLAVSPYGMQLGSISEHPVTFQDAVVFYRRHFRFFESADRSFDHPTPIQGRWKINGISLPRPVLRKLYYENADKLIFRRRMKLE